MTSREAFRLYRESTLDKPPHERVYFFHAHIYYNSDDAVEVAKMKALLETLQSTLSKDDHYEIHTLQVIFQQIKLCKACQASSKSEDIPFTLQQRFHSVKFPANGLSTYLPHNVL